MPIAELTKIKDYQNLLIIKIDEIEKVAEDKDKAGLPFAIETGIALGIKIAYQIFDEVY